MSIFLDDNEVLQLCSEGLSNEDIAIKLFCHSATVKVNLEASYRRLGVKNREQAVKKACQKKLIKGPTPPRPKVKLEDREFKIMRLMAAGHRNEVIAKKMGLKSVNTLRYYINVLFKKLKAENRFHAIAICVKLGLI